MPVSGKSRTSIYRRRKHVIKALGYLLEKGIIGKKDYKRYSSKAAELYEEWIDKWREDRPKTVRPRGRPPIAGRSQLRKCKRLDCPKRPAQGQAYCDRNCAPYGHFGVSEE